MSKLAQTASFRRSVKLEQRTEIPIRVFGKDATVLAERSLVFGADAVKASLSPAGRRLALIIATAPMPTPCSRRWKRRSTTRGRYRKPLPTISASPPSLETAPGKSRDLLLTDATKMDILKALSDLRKYLTAEDQLVIFYAGHGVIDQERPATGCRSTPPRKTIPGSAPSTSRKLRKIASGAVLLISDSCYAGGLSRDAAPAKADETRDRYLAKSMRYKARQLIASGGNEPVADGGGKGHSLFAQALLDALVEMPENGVHRQRAVRGQDQAEGVSSAFATSAKGQTPVFYRITHAGDEPESEFVFVRK